MIGVISSRVKLILYSVIGICIFVLAIATFIHFAFGGDKQETPPANEDKTPPVHMEMKEQRTRSIHYAQKAKGEDTDIQIEDKQKPIVVSVNGKRKS